jgi:hypothetical protein
MSTQPEQVLENQLIGLPSKFVTIFLSRFINNSSQFHFHF